MINPLTDNNGLMIRWTDYFNELYNYPIKTNEELVKETITFQYIALPIINSEVRHFINTLKNGKASGIDNILSELIKYGGGKLLDIKTSLCQQMWEIKEWPCWTTIDQITNYPLSK